jgi:hypothetical protein
MQHCFNPTTLDEIWKTTTIYLEMDNNLIFLNGRRLKKVYHGRRPTIFENQRQPQFYGK